MRLQSWVLLVGATVLSGVGACGDPAAPEKQAFEVLLTSNFQDEHVSVELDHQLVYSGSATTNPMVGVAAIMPLTARPGRHDVRVLAGLDEVRETFELDAYLYVLVGRDGSGELRIRVTPEWPGYD